MLGEGGSKIFGKKIDVGGGRGQNFLFPVPPYDAKWNSPQKNTKSKDSRRCNRSTV